MVKISVVIPVYNAEPNLAELYRQLKTVLNELNEAYEIILVDDGSRDGSLACLLDMQQCDPQVKVIGLEGNFGQQKAVAWGLLQAQGQQIIIMDDDLQHPPTEIPNLLSKLAEGYDLVFGIPYKKQHALYRKVGTCLTDAVFKLACLKDSSIKISSFRAVRQEVVKAAFRDWRGGFVYISAQLLLVTKQVTCLKVTHNPRTRGRTNYNPWKLAGLLGRVFFYYYLCPGRRKKSTVPPCAVRISQR